MHHVTTALAIFLMIAILAYLVWFIAGSWRRQSAELATLLSTGVAPVRPDTHDCSFEGCCRRAVTWRGMPRGQTFFACEDHADMFPVWFRGQR